MKRMVLEPVTLSHASELTELLSDPDLHQFTPHAPPSLQVQLERCLRWEKRVSPDGKEYWLNWVGRETNSQKVIAHFQAGMRSDFVATLGYLLAKPYHGQGFASEGLIEIFKLLKATFEVREVRAYIDTLNESSIRLAERLGMKKVEFIKDADQFKGSSSDEFMYAIKLDSGRLE